MDEEQPLRDCTDLWALSDTTLCMLHRCIPCAYKLLIHPPTVLDGEKVSPPCHKNIRPELCPRQSGKKPATARDNRIGLYTCAQRLLIVGDGDFTFSLALAKSLGPKANIVCTSYQSKEEVQSIYKDASKTLEELSQYAGVKVQHNVDATDLQSAFGKEERFSRILFNFPCVPDQVGQDGQTNQLEENQALIRGFLASAASLLCDQDAEIHIVHKTKPPFSWWKIPTLCPAPEQDENAVQFLRAVVFDRSIYAGYIPRKVGENKSFPVFDAVTYCFARPGAQDPSLKLESSEPEKNITPDTAAAVDLVKLTPGRLLQVVAMLQLASTAPVAAHLEEKKRARPEDSLFQPKKRDTKKSRQRGKKQKSKR